MANISVFHDSILTGGSFVTATGIDANSSAAYLRDDRLSFKFVTSGTNTTVSIDQQVANNRSFTDLILADHNIDGGTISVTSFTNAGRGSATTELAEINIPNEDPFIVAMDGALTNTQFVDIDIAASGTNTMSIGEVQLSTKFTSPQRPAIGIRTTYIPRMTVITLLNGEKQTIKHAETSRRKEYTIGGLTIAEAAQWSDLFIANEGAGLVVLSDDVGDEFVCMMNTELTVSDDSKIVSIDLTFEEIKL